MDRATNRIVEAMKFRQKIAIIGDYDVDGVTATTILKLFFNEIDYPIEWIIPNRFKDGYGLSTNIIEKMEDVNLAITVDNGISAVEAAKLCKKCGIELIITDHHIVPDIIPEAYAIVNQKQKDCHFKYDEVCGAQIAWYLIASLKNALDIKVDMVRYLEFVSIAIIADMMPLKHINRAMVLAGLKSMVNSNNQPIRAFKEYFKKETLSSEDIAFFLAPILNSAGRMDDASFSVDFLSSTNIYDARVRLNKLIEFNELRKETEKDITQKAIDQVDSSDAILVLSGESWHEGVVGIVAARVSRLFKKPSIILSQNKNGILKGSGRTFGEINLFSIVQIYKHHLLKFGGHKAAIGLSLKQENLEIFKKDLQNINYKNDDSIYIDKDIVGELNFSDISFNMLNIIDKYAPYGQSNPVPKFISKNIKILDVNSMGKNSEHRRFLFLQNDITIKGVKFKTDEDFTQGSIVDIVYTLNKNEFRGETTIQIMVDYININL